MSKIIQWSSMVVCLLLLTAFWLNDPGLLQAQESTQADSEQNRIEQKDTPLILDLNQMPANQPERGLVFDGLERNLAGPCGNLFQLQGTTICTHGPDQAPSGVDITRSVEPIINAAELAAPAVCDGDGVSGNRVQVMYARASDRPDRYNQYLASIRQWATESDQIYYESAIAVGPARNIRFVHDASCVTSVLNIVLSPSGDDNMDNTVNQLAALGHNRTDRKYMIFMDANVYCGIGDFYNDDSPGQTNENNVVTGYGRTDSGCWDAGTVAHELNHNLGGVQDSASHSSRGGHCVDEYDVMCYSDEPYYPAMQYLCNTPALEDRLDCNHDDYYHPNPPAGSYLATHWNTANSRFLISGAANFPPPSNLQANAISSSQINLSWRDNSTTETGFKIERCNGAGCTNFSQIATVAANIVSYANTALTAGTTYSYRVRATTGATDSSYSNQAAATTAQAGCTVYNSSDVPKTIADNSTVTSTISVPANLTITDVNLRNLNIGHTYVDDLVARLINPAGTTQVSLFNRLGNTGDNFVNTNLDDAAATALTAGAPPYTGVFRPLALLSGFNGQNTNGIWRLVIADIATTDTGALTGWSLELCGNATTSLPAAPNPFTATTVSQQQINLAWKDNANNESGFKLERCTGANCTSFSQIISTTANTTGYTDGSLAANTTYCYRVRAYNGAGDSGYSNTSCSSTGQPAPTNLTASRILANEVNLAWVESSTSETGFKLERCLGATCTNFAEIVQVAANVVGYHVTGLTPASTYRFRVRGYAGTVNTAYSNIVNVSTPVARTIADGEQPAAESGETGIIVHLVQAQGDVTVAHTPVCTLDSQPTGVTLQIGDHSFAMSESATQSQLFSALVSLQGQFSSGQDYLMQVRWNCTGVESAQEELIGILQVAADAAPEATGNMRVFLPVITNQ